LPKCCAEHQKPDAFQRFCPTFQKLFLKSDFFDSFNGLCYPRVGGRGFCLGAGKTRSHKMVSLVEWILTLQKQNPCTPQEQEMVKREIESTDRAIDKLVYELNGLSEEEIKIVEG
jgi:hypothetical protein